MSRAGYVLVGGRSSRMGRDKALLPFGGRALAASIARTVSQAAGSATLVGSSQRYGALGFPVTPDLYPGEGPLGGILTALQHSTAEWNLIVACDMPELTAGFLRQLLDAAEGSAADALIPVGPSGRMEPLCAVYRGGETRQALYTAFARGVRKVTAAFESLRIVTLALPQAVSPEVSPFQNVNTPEDWAPYAAK